MGPQRKGLAVHIDINKVSTGFASTLILLVIATIDYYTGYDFGFYVFYDIPVLLASWYLGIVWGIVFSLLSATSWLTVDLLHPNPYISITAEYWNALINLISFIILVIGISIIKSGVERGNKIHKDLRQRSEELTITNRDLQTYSYSIAHDLKNPLIIITAFAEIVKESESKLDSEQRDAIARILSESRRMNDIINDLLRLSRVGVQDIELADVNLSEIAAASVSGLIDVYEDSPTYRVEIEPHLHAKGDAGLLRILFNNLIGNAIKFSSKSKSPQIFVGSINQNNETVFYVRDNGIGFEQEKTEKIFDPFIRLHSQKDFPGTGIGLAIVRKIVERHNGRIWAKSQKGVGTTIYFTLLKSY